MALLCYLVTEFLNYFLAYLVIFGLEVSKSRVRWGISIGGIVVGHLVVYFLWGMKSASMSSIILMSLIPLLLFVSTKNVKKIIIYPFIVMSISNISVCVSFLVAIILEVPEAVILDDMWLTAFCQISPIIFMILLKVYKQNKKQNTPISLNWKQYIVLYIVPACLIFMLGPIQFISENESHYMYFNYLGLSTSIACLALISNLVQNLIDACKKIEDENRGIWIEWGEYNSHFYMMIKNTVDKDVFIKNGHIMTTKKDKKQHEFGITNIKNVVKKYNGEIKFSMEDGYFGVEIDI